MGKKLDGRVALVTGGSRGIGRAIAEALATEGAAVAINYVNPGNAPDEVKAAVEKRGGKVLLVQADISDYDQVQGMVDTVVMKWGHIDILISNAAVTDFTSFLEFTRESWQRLVDVNLSGTFYVTQAVARQMVKQGKGGKIIQISTAGVVVSVNRLAAYVATKTGAERMMKVLALELAPHNIQVNSVAPGTIQTDINRVDLSDPVTLKLHVDSIPLGRVGIPDDIAGAVVFLASNDASYVTGSTIIVDGGVYAKQRYGQEEV